MATRVVTIVSEQRGRIRGDHTQASVRQESALYQGLEAVADSQDEPSAIQQGVNLVRYLAVVKYVRYELAASVRLVSGREASAEHEYLTF